MGGPAGGADGLTPPFMPIMPGGPPADPPGPPGPPEYRWGLGGATPPAGESIKCIMLFVKPEIIRYS